ncbi:MAG TPA: hypothetical protein VFH88_06400 [Candidatus Krumholzibacteria bacterium]|nr:hypothetical protein [Candidatus Krumholzibacteria bacterium]
MNWFYRVLALLVCVVCAACSNNPVSEDKTPPENPTKANQIATEGFTALGDALAALNSASNSELRNVRFNSERSQFEEALKYQANNGVAHLGLAILEIVELNYSSDIWAVVDSLQSWGCGPQGILPPVELTPFDLAPVDARHMLLGRQFQLAVMLPVATSTRMAAAFPANVTVGKVQDIITNTVIPALNRSIKHLDIVEKKTGTSLHLTVQTGHGTEDIVIDMGEILVFSAAVHALRSGFSAATAYDEDVFDHDGTYDWLDQICYLANDNCRYAWTVDATDIGGGMVDLKIFRTYDDTSTAIDSIWIDLAHYNMETRTGFLSLRNGGTPLSNAQTDLLGTLTRLESAVTFIRNRQNESDQNVIKLADLTDLDSGLGDPGAPNFAKNWTKVEDVIAFIQQVLSGPVVFNEELGSHHVPFTWTVNLSTLYTNPVPDWNTLLPYHRWNIPGGAWRTSVDSLTTYNNSGYEWWNYAHTGPHSCGFVYYPSVNDVTLHQRWWSFDGASFFDLLDGPNGNPVDLQTARFPYLPDYTLHGLFPDMTRARWLELIDILDPPASMYLVSGRGRSR